MYGVYDWSDRPPQMRRREAFELMLRLRMGGLDRNIDREDEHPDNPLVLSHHPFGLWAPEGFPHRDGHVRLVLSYMSRDYFLWRAFTHLREGIVHGLRTTHAEAVGPGLGKHDVYHEVVVTTNCIVHNKATDYSGGGGETKGILDGFFEILSHVYGLEVQKTILPYDRAEKARKYILEASCVQGREWSRRRHRR